MTSDCSVSIAYIDKQTYKPVAQGAANYNCNWFTVSRVQRMEDVKPFFFRLFSLSRRNREVRGYIPQYEIKLCCASSRHEISNTGRSELMPYAISSYDYIASKQPDM